MQKAIIGILCFFGLAFAAIFGMVGGYALMKLESFLTSQSVVRQRGRLQDSEEPQSLSRYVPRGRTLKSSYRGESHFEDDAASEEVVEQFPRVIQRTNFVGRRSAAIQQAAAQEEQDAQRDEEFVEPTRQGDFVPLPPPLKPEKVAAKASSRTRVLPSPSPFSAARVAAADQAPVLPQADTPVPAPIPGPNSPATPAQPPAPAAAPPPKKDPVSVKGITVVIEKLEAPPPIRGNKPHHFQ